MGNTTEYNHKWNIEEVISATKSLKTDIFFIKNNLGKDSSEVKFENENLTSVDREANNLAIQFGMSNKNLTAK